MLSEGKRLEERKTPLAGCPASKKRGEENSEEAKTEEDGRGLQGIG